MTKNTLVVVHPGSMYGSAAMHLGKSEAERLRHLVLDEVDDHVGNVIIIDGALSDEISDEDDLTIESALRLAQDTGSHAVRIWGCDAGEDPFMEWSGMGPGNLSFGSQEEAAASIADLIKDTSVVVTGAWGADDLSTGCASSVVVKLREVMGDTADISLSDNAIRELEDPEPGF